LTVAAPEATIHTSMRRHLSQDLRERIVEWYLDGRDTNEIAELAGCSRRTVFEIARLYREFGDVYNPHTRRRGRPRALNPGDITFLCSLLDATPTLYLDEIQDRLFSMREVDVSLATLSRTLRRIAITHKRTSTAAVERNEELRAVWQGAYGHHPKEYFVWLDESSVDNLTNQRDGGWSVIGQACVRRATFLRGQRYSVLPALTTDGIIALDIFEGSVTKERFLRFVEEELAPKLNPFPGSRSIAVLDNCAIHHDEDIRKIIEDDCGAKLIYLPPYSPDFNPIEQAFHTMKAWLRRHEDRAISPNVRPWLIHQAMMSILPQDAVGWILNCGYD